MDAEAERLAAEEDAAWAEIHAAFESIPAERFEEPRLTSEGWSPRDAMFHIAAWCAEAANQLERMRLGTLRRPEDRRPTRGTPNGSRSRSTSTRPP